MGNCAELRSSSCQKRCRKDPAMRASRTEMVVMAGGPGKLPIHTLLLQTRPGGKCRSSAAPDSQPSINARAVQTDVYVISKASIPRQIKHRIAGTPPPCERMENVIQFADYEVLQDRREIRRACFRSRVAG